MKIYDTNSNDDAQSSVTDIANAAYVQFYVWYILPARDHPTGNIQSWSHKFQPRPKNMPPKNMPSKQKKRAALRTRDENSSRANDKGGATTVKVVSSKKQKQNKTNNKNNNGNNSNDNNNTGNYNNDDVVIHHQKPPPTTSSAASLFHQPTTTTAKQQPPSTIGPNNISHQASDVSSSLTGTPQDLTNEINCESGNNNHNNNNNNNAANTSLYNPTPASANDKTNAASEVYCDWNREQHGILTTVLDDKKRTLQRYVRETLFAHLKFITCDSELDYTPGKSCDQLYQQHNGRLNFATLYWLVRNLILS